MEDYCGSPNLFQEGECIVALGWLTRTGVSSVFSCSDSFRQNDSRLCASAA